MTEPTTTVAGVDLRPAIDELAEVVRRDRARHRVSFERYGFAPMPLCESDAFEALEDAALEPRGAVRDLLAGDVPALAFIAARRAFRLVAAEERAGAPVSA